MADQEIPALDPWQCCFVVDDVPAAVASSSQRFGWGPFQEFSAPVEDASYRDWSGSKLTDVALGMAGHVQIEFIHVHKGHDAVESYQAEYGTGFQHLGVRCRSRDAALAHLEALGGRANELLEYSGIRIAFVDIPTGDAMFELLQPAPRDGDKRRASKPGDKPKKTTPPAALEVDRATIVTRDIEATLRFYSAAFRWPNSTANAQTLRHGKSETRAKRFIGRAKTLELELIEPDPASTDPYAEHLKRGAHGLVHPGGLATASLRAEAKLECEWLETSEPFQLIEGPAGHVAVRDASSPSAHA